MKIIAGCSSVNLTHAVCKILGTEPIIPTYKRFSDGEISIDIVQKDIQDDTCLLIHSLSDPVNDNIIVLLLTIDALKRCGSNKIIVCLPYLAYTRPEQKVSWITSLMHTAGAHHCITIEPHAPVESTSIPIDALSTTQLFADHINATQNLDDLVMIAPDQGGIERCRQVHNARDWRLTLYVSIKFAQMDYAQCKLFMAMFAVNAVLLQMILSILAQHYAVLQRR